MKKNDGPMLNEQTEWQSQLGAQSDPGQDGWTPVKPVANAIQILRLIARTEDPATLTQIARSIGANPSTCLSILRTLTAEQMLTFNARAKTYSAGPELSTVFRGRGETSLEASLKTPMLEFAQAHALTVSLWKRSDDDHIALIHSVVGSQAISIQMRIGQRLPRWVAAIGRVMAAESGADEDVIAQGFQRLRWQSPLTLDEYMEQVREVARLGYAMDVGHYVTGLVSIAVPIRGRAEKATYGYSISMFDGRFDQAQLEAIAAELIDMAEAAAS